MFLGVLETAEYKPLPALGSSLRTQNLRLSRHCDLDIHPHRAAGRSCPWVAGSSGSRHRSVDRSPRVMSRQAPSLARALCLVSGEKAQDEAGLGCSIAGGALGAECDPDAPQVALEDPAGFARTIP